MIEPHDIQTVPKEEQNALLVANNEPDHERHPFEEGSPYPRFLLTMSRSISSVLIFFTLQKQQGDSPTLVM